MPLWPASEGSLQVSYTCSACGLSYRRVADTDQFAGVANLKAERNDVVIFSGHYIHCGQALQETACGWLRFDSPLDGEKESWTTMTVCIEIRVLECPCGFRLILPD